LANPASIVLNTSVNAHIGMPNSSVYAASKAALQSVIRTLSGELIGRGIRLNAVGPASSGLPVRRAAEGLAEAIGKGAQLGRGAPVLTRKPGRPRTLVMPCGPRKRQSPTPRPYHAPTSPDRPPGALLCRSADASPGSRRHIPEAVFERQAFSLAGCRM